MGHRYWKQQNLSFPPSVTPSTRSAFSFSSLPIREFGGGHIVGWHGGRWWFVLAYGGYSCHSGQRGLTHTAIRHSDRVWWSACVKDIQTWLLTINTATLFSPFFVDLTSYYLCLVTVLFLVAPAYSNVDTDIYVDWTMASVSLLVFTSHSCKSCRYT